MPSNTRAAAEKPARPRRPWQGEAQGEGESFGTWLRRQRELREIHLREIGEHTKISLRYLRAMEQDRFDILPGEVFTRGFLREYGRYVGLDPDEVVTYYQATREARQEEVEDLVAEAQGPSSFELPKRLLLVLALILAALAVGYWVWTRVASEPPAEPSAQAPVERGLQPASEAEPAGQGADSAQPAAANELATASDPKAPVAVVADVEEAPLRVTLDFFQDCWVEVLVDGRRRIAERRVQGESLQISARESVVLTTLGNSGGVSVEVNDQPFDIGGRPNVPLRDIRIDLETVRQLRSPPGAAGLEGAVGAAS